MEEEYVLKNPMIRIKTPKTDKKIRVALDEEELEILNILDKNSPTSIGGEMNYYIRC